jgi:murein hydrolase activator
MDKRHLFGLLLVLIVMAMTVAPLAAQSTPTGFIRVMDLTMRSGPGQQTRPIKTLAHGDLVTVLGRNNGWLKILHQGHTGYILNNPAYVRLLSVDGPPSVDGTPSEDTLAQTETPDRLSREEIEARLRSSTAQLAAISEKETALMDAVDQMQKQVNRKRRQVLATEADLGAIEEQILAETGQLEEIEAGLEKNSAYAGLRVRALHQLNTLGTLPVLANADSWMDFLKRKSALSMVIEADQRLLESLAADRRQQEELLAQLSQRRSERGRLEAAMHRELADLTARLAERTDLLARIQSEASLQEELIKGLKASAEALDTVITQLNQPEPPKPVQKVEPEPETVAAASEEAGPPQKGPRPFIKLKGLLNLPVNGKIISSYGHYRSAEFNVMNFRSGVLIRADRGEPIHAVANGTTLFADWFKGYGNMLIIDHGDHYYTVYAHLEELFKARGDSVDADEVIATVGEAGTLTGPGLHFEVRHHGKPVDPLTWLRTTDRAASDRKKGVKG